MQSLSIEAFLVDAAGVGFPLALDPPALTATRCDRPDVTLCGFVPPLLR
jgi:hypothetical protein